MRSTLGARQSRADRRFGRKAAPVERYCVGNVGGERGDRAQERGCANRGDIEEVLAFTDADAELHSKIIGGAEGNLYRGHDGFRKWFAESTASFEQLDTELTEFRTVDDRVIAFGRIYVRGRASGVELDSETGWVFTVRGSKIVKAEGFLSRAEALEAAGLSE